MFYIILNGITDKVQFRAYDREQADKVANLLAKQFTGREVQIFDEKKHIATVIVDPAQPTLFD